MTAPAAPESVAYRSARTRARVAMALIGATVTAVGLMGVAMAQGYGLIDRFGSLGIEEEIAAFDDNVNTLTGLYYLLLLCSAIAYWAWLHRATSNVPALGGGRPTFTPNSAVGWWFVPLANLVQGYRSLADLSRRMAATTAEQGTGLVMAWWLLWLGSNFAMSAISQSTPVTAETLRTYFAIGIVLYVANAASGVILVRLIWLVEKRAHLRAAAFAPAAWAAQPAVGEAPPAPVSLIGPTAAVARPTTPNERAPRSGIAFCPYCGAERFRDARYCGGCGRDLEVLGGTEVSG